MSFANKIMPDYAYHVQMELIEGHSIDVPHTSACPSRSRGRANIRAMAPSLH